MADKEKLNDMVDNIINQKPEQAQVDFHDYLQSRFTEFTGQQKDNDSDKQDNEE